jgi:hypothetical protein
VRALKATYARGCPVAAGETFQLERAVAESLAGIGRVELVGG